jgi:hypothetical protein
MCVRSSRGGTPYLAARLRPKTPRPAHTVLSKILHCVRIYPHYAMPCEFCPNAARGKSSLNESPSLALTHTRPLPPAAAFSLTAFRNYLRPMVFFAEQPDTGAGMAAAAAAAAAGGAGAGAGAGAGGAGAGAGGAGAGAGGAGAGLGGDAAAEAQDPPEDEEYAGYAEGKVGGKRGRGPAKEKSLAERARMLVQDYFRAGMQVAVVGFSAADGLVQMEGGEPRGAAAAALAAVFVAGKEHVLTALREDAAKATPTVEAAKGMLCTTYGEIGPFVLRLVPSQWLSLPPFFCPHLLAPFSSPAVPFCRGLFPR